MLVLNAERQAQAPGGVMACAQRNGRFKKRGSVAGHVGIDFE